MNENIESFNAFWAFERVVGEVGEIAMYGAFVGKYHIELIQSYVPQHVGFYVQ